MNYFLFPLALRFFATAFGRYANTHPQILIPSPTGITCRGLARGKDLGFYQPRKERHVYPI